MERRPGSVLVLAEDDELRRALAALLGSGGFSVATARDAAQVTQRLRWPGVPDVMLLGGMVRSQEARRLFQWMALHPQLTTLPMVLLTAELPPPELAACFVARLCPPFSNQRVLRVLRETCLPRRRPGRLLWEPISDEEAWVDVEPASARSAEGGEPIGPSPSHSS